MICTRKIENLPIDATPNNYKQLLQITRVTGQWLQPTSITPFAATFQTPYLFFFSRFLRRPRASPFFFLARSFTPFLSLAACSLSRQNSFIAVRRRSGSSFPLDSFQLDVGTLVEEENPFYVVRKGDIVGVYKTFSECQHQLSSSVFDPAVSVYKGYSLSEESEEYLTSHGLKNAVYSINSRDLKEDLFGSLVPCPIQVHALKASGHQGVKGLPPSFSKNKEHFQVALGTGDSPARGECITKIGSPDLCGSVPSVSFDICMPPKACPIKLNPSLLQQNREKRKERKQAKISNQNMRLQPGMILLKNFFKYNDQVEIIRQCQRLGVGSGGFYQPGYVDGAKLSLQMMCLGKNWDPLTSLYEDTRRVDGAKAPQIPVHFKKLVEEAIHTSHTLIQQHTGSSHPVKAELPNMLPDLCIINFY